MPPSIEVNNVWKQYPSGGLLQRALHVLRPPPKPERLGQGPGWAVRDVSFALEPGQTLGLIGRNGAGKSTMLRLLAGLTGVTAGTVGTQGRIASLIALGAGFHRELSGRENIYLNGVILGASRPQIRRRFDEIVDFAELGEYMDMPVKYYSSGMYARLGFSVAAHVDPDILLVDEVLSVGDQAFQSKSLSRMSSFAESGTTVVFVSHRLPAIAAMCRESLWLDSGRIRMHGSTDEVSAAYLEDLDRQIFESSSSDSVDAIGSGEILVDRVQLSDGLGNERTDFRRGDSVTVDLHYRVVRPVTNAMFVVIISTRAGENLFAANMVLDGYETGAFHPGTGSIRCMFNELPLLPGAYNVVVQVVRDVAGNSFAPRPMARFSVVGRMAEWGLVGRYAEGKSRGSTAISVPYRWEPPATRTAIETA